MSSRLQRARVDAERYAAYERAAALMRNLIASPTFTNFLTEPAYAQVLQDERLTTSA